MAATCNAQPGCTQVVRPERLNPYRGLFYDPEEGEEAAFEGLQSFGIDE